MTTKSAAKTETTGIQMSEDNFSLWVVVWSGDVVVDDIVEVVGNIDGVVDSVSH